MRARVAALALSVATGVGALASALAPASGAARATGAERLAAPAVPRLAAVRVAAHRGYDRIVFEFAGSLPAVHSVAPVARVTADPSGRPLALGGRAFLRVVFRQATAHTAAGARTYAGALPGRVDLPVVRSVVQAGDFENVLSFGVGLWEHTSTHVFVLEAPPRLVVDVRTPATAPTRLTELDAGRLVYLTRGERTTVALRTCTSCGYSWRVARAPAGTVARIVSTSVVPLPHDPGVVGAPYESRWVLRAVGDGRTALELDETPPQRGAAPVARYVLRFDVAG